MGQVRTLFPSTRPHRTIRSADYKVSGTSRYSFRVRTYLYKRERPAEAGDTRIRYSLEQSCPDTTSGS